jgi:biotin carboxyl carrier protein
MRFQASVGDRSFDMTLDGDQLLVDGTPVAYHFERIGPDTFHLLLDGASHTLTLQRQDDGTVRVTAGGRTVPVRVRNEKDLLLERFGLADAGDSAASELRAPMPGLVLSVLVEAGQTVAPGDGLVVLEAMKMENELRATAAGTVQAVHVSPGAAVGKSALLLTFEG